jgi:hypothetical protein
MQSLKIINPDLHTFIEVVSFDGIKQKLNASKRPYVVVPE